MTSAQSHRSPEREPLDDPEPGLDRSLRRFALRLVRDASAAEDIVQDAWLARLLSSEEDEPRDGASASRESRQRGRWMFGVVRNLSQKHRQRAGRRREIEQFGSAASEVPAADEATARASSLELLRSCLESLREPYRSTLRRRYLEERTLEEIAHADGVSEETVKSRDRRGRLELRTLLDRACCGGREEWVGAFLFASLGPEALAQTAAGSAGAAPAASSARRLPGRRLGLAPKTLAAVLVLVLPTAAYFALQRIETRFESSLEAQSAERRAALDPAAKAEMRDEGTALAWGEETALTRQSARAGADSVPRSVDVAPETRRLEVRVEDAAGVPVPFADVDLLAGSGGRFRALKADETGFASIDVLPDERLPPSLVPGPEGGVLLSARARGGAWSALYRIPLPRAGRALTVQVGGAGQDLEGVVLDPSGRPVVGAAVALRRETSGEQSTPDGVVFAERGYIDWTDAEGRFDFVGLPRRLHRFEVSARGWIAQQGLVEGDTASLAVEVVLEAGVTLRGEVTFRDGSRAAGADVWEARLATTPADGLPRTVADQDGRFELRGLAPGHRRLFASAAEDPSLQAELLLDVESEDPPAWSATLEPAEPLRVRVLEAGGEPVANASVMVLAMDDGPDWGTLVKTNARGVASLAVVPRGRLAVNARWGASPLISVEERGVFARDGEVVLREPGAEVLEGALIGTLLDHSGAPFRAAAVVACGPGELLQLPVDPATGTLRVEGRPAGPYTLWALVPERGRVDLGAVTIPAGGIADFGVRRAPAPVRVERGAPGLPSLAGALLEVDGPCLRARPVRVLPEHGSDLLLFPGEYSLRWPDEPDRVALDVAIDAGGRLLPVDAAESERSVER